MAKIKITIEYEIKSKEKKILDKYGYDFIKNAEDIAKQQAEYVAAELKKCEEENID